MLDEVTRADEPDELNDVNEPMPQTVVIMDGEPLVDDEVDTDDVGAKVIILLTLECWIHIDENDEYDIQLV